MNDNVKILLSIQLQGGTLVRKSDPVKIPWLIILGDARSKKLPEKFANKIVRKGRTDHYELEAKPAVLSVKLRQEAYDYMTSPDSWQPWMKSLGYEKKSQFSKATATQRLEAHLASIYQHHKGVSYSYVILD